MVQIAVPPMIPLEQLRKMKKQEERGYTEEKPYQLLGVTGRYANAVFPLDEPIVIGREAGKVQICYPADTGGISRKHCCLELNAKGEVILEDMESSAGTYFGNGTKLEPWRRNVIKREKNSTLRPGMRHTG